MQSLLSSVPPASASAGCNTVDRLLAPLGIAEFLLRDWGKRHRFVHRRDPRHYEDLFTLDDLDRCLAVGTSNLGVIVSFVAPKTSDRKSVEGAITAETRDLAYKRFALGDTLRLVGIEKLSPPVLELALHLKEALGVKVHVNAYLTPESSQGFDVHFDYHDALILQVSGSKRWFVYEPDHQSPVDLPFAKIWDSSPGDDSHLALREEALLEQGDFLYIPRGFYHKARTADSHSLHLTVSLDPVYWVSVLQKSLELLCVELPELRQALPPGFPSRMNAREDLAGTFTALLDLVRERASFEKTAGALLRDEFSSTSHPPDGHFADLVGLAEIGLDTPVEKRVGMAPRVELHQGGAVIQFGASHVQGPAGILPALEFARDHRTFTARDLPGALEETSRVILVRRLVREGLLTVVRR